MNVPRGTLVFENGIDQPLQKAEQGNGQNNQKQVGNEAGNAEHDVLTIGIGTRKTAVLHGGFSYATE